MTLFPTSRAKSKSKLRPAPRDPAAIRIPTGVLEATDAHAEESAG